jgi:ubiquinone/menaquinone biosynthesis C-methylase UbiE
MDTFTSGSSVEFDESWKTRAETHYNHWCRSVPRNQIQLAFANHFRLFSAYLRRDGAAPGSCLEVGAGRGSISSFFAAVGCRCTLLDSSAAVLSVAEQIFAANGHDASYVVGDANRLDFPDGRFDVVVSIGLLEHFENIDSPLREQLRVLKPGGRCFCYVVPENPLNVQRYFRFVNTALRRFSRNGPRAHVDASKQPVYRTATLSSEYLAALKAMGATEIEATGMYPLPMISSSPEFPFTLMSPTAERALTYVYRGVLALRELFKPGRSWACREQFGQAFLVTFRKS